MDECTFLLIYISISNIKTFLYGSFFWNILTYHKNVYENVVYVYYVLLCETFSYMLLQIAFFLFRFSNLFSVVPRVVWEKKSNSKSSMLYIRDNFDLLFELIVKCLARGTSTRSPFGKSEIWNPLLCSISVLDRRVSCFLLALSLELHDVNRVTHPNVKNKGKRLENLSENN